MQQIYSLRNCQLCDKLTVGQQKKFKQMVNLHNFERNRCGDVLRIDIPTIPTDDAEPDDSVDLNQQIAIAPA